MKPRPTYITVASSHNAVGWVPSGSLRSPTLGRGDTLAVCAGASSGLPVLRISIEQALTKHLGAD